MSKYEGHTPLPCPFCGSDPRVFPQVDPERAGNAWGAVACVNPDCPTYLEHGGFGLRGSGVHVYDGIDVADERGSEAYKAAAIRRWNRRAADAPKLLAQRDALLAACKRLLQHLPIKWHSDPSNRAVREAARAAIENVES